MPPGRGRGLAPLRPLAGLDLRPRVDAGPHPGVDVGAATQGSDGWGFESLRAHQAGSRQDKGKTMIRRSSSVDRSALEMTNFHPGSGSNSGTVGGVGGGE